MFNMLRTIEPQMLSYLIGCQVLPPDVWKARHAALQLSARHHPCQMTFINCPMCVHRETSTPFKPGWILSEALLQLGADLYLYYTIEHSGFNKMISWYKSKSPWFFYVLLNIEPKENGGSLVVIFWLTV